MKPIKLIIQIELADERRIGCGVSDEVETNYLDYHRDERILIFAEENALAKKIQTNSIQFEKIIRSAIKGKIRVGQTIHAVFIEDFPFLKDADFLQYIRVDRRNGDLKITTHQSETAGIHQIYADGSCTVETGQSGFGGFIETPDGKRKTFKASLNGGSNNLMELLAVTEGLKQLKTVSQIRINTDSRFVIRGLVQWVHFWKHNNWQTAYGQKVKFAQVWQEIDALCADKFIEFRWIKGHSGHEEQSICHDLAKQSTTFQNQTTSPN